MTNGPLRAKKSLHLEGLFWPPPTLDHPSDVRETPPIVLNAGSGTQV